ncbi:tRNA-guanine(15) transglycosylase-like protein [Tribonema minus]|uniref:Queuine tRNA-ribosyltransferase catalytic subunit 1 n=1 Tax=Tribonema minus TaxID=303371 RepID=A0A835YSH0_9STRA|nr:tRNA-guanine(15) transglycosylase-like protein [Tribonema minus]
MEAVDREVRHHSQQHDIDCHHQHQQQHYFQPEGAVPIYTDASPALCFYVHAEHECRARAGTLHLPHGPVRTPLFMPVGTKAVIKGMLSSQLMVPALSPEIILANTYHCALEPGTDLLEEFGGLHEFMNWKGNLLTDSGGFQMVSLLKLAVITEEGVTFKSPMDGTPMLLTPEESIAHQNRIGSDIIMQLDDVVSSVANDDARFAEAAARSVRWLDRCVAAHARPRQQSLFAIVQGGLDTSHGGLREQCLEAMIGRNMPGYAIGGMAGGEEKDVFWRVVAQACDALPPGKPRYLMGVGYPLDLVVCTALGCDMFDCVYPTRTARFGVALVPGPTGLLRLRGREALGETGPIQEGCPCAACAGGFGRARLAQLLRGAALGCQLVTAHNLCFVLHLMRSMRAALLAGTFPAFVRSFVQTHFEGSAGGVPAWVCDALSHAGISLTSQTACEHVTEASAHRMCPSGD